MLNDSENHLSVKVTKPKQVSTKILDTIYNELVIILGLRSVCLKYIFIIETSKVV